MSKKGKKNGKNTAYILSVVFGGVIGGCLAKLMLDKDNGTGLDPLQMFLVLWMIAVSLLFHIITHEAGHMICGLLSGYRFVSFRIGSFTLVKANGKFSIKRFQIPGTGGQCLMAPPPKNESGDFPLLLYNLGGVLSNLFFSVVFTIIAVNIRDHALLHAVMLAFAGTGYLIFLTNGIPLKAGGISNDGYNIFAANKDRIGAKSFYIQMDVNAKLSDGKRMSLIPWEEIDLPEDSDISNPLIICVFIFQYYWYADRQEYDKAEEVITRLLPQWNQTIPLLKNMISIERIFLEVMGEDRDSVIDELLTKEMKAYLKNAKYDVHCARTRYILELRKDPNSDQSKQLKKEFLKIVKQASVSGEAAMSAQMVEDVEVFIQARMAGKMEEEASIGRSEN